MIGLALVLVLGLAAVPVSAEEATLNGSIVCAKCVLKKADATECQNVLVVKDAKATTEYYIAKNAVSEKFGHVCTNEVAATVTGAVSEKDGKKWIAPSKMEKTASKS
jgi:hypothetical protein